MTTLSTRNPCSTDDNTAGYAVFPAANSFWGNQATGTLYKCLRNTASKAVWQPITPVLPCDSLGISATVAYGTTRLFATYTGYAFRIKRASDNTTLDVGFVGNLANWAAVDSFCAGTIGTFVIWYDQSGNGLNAVAGANAPSVTTNTINGQRCISFGTNNGYYQSFTLPSGVTLARQCYSAVMGYISPGPATGSTSYFVVGTDASYLNNSLIVTQNNGQYQAIGNTQPELTHADSEPSVMVYSSGSSTQNFYVNEQSTSATAMTAFSLVGGAIGLYTGYHFEGDLLSFILYPTPLTSTQATTIKQAMYAQYNMAPQLVDRFIAIGDSITAGANADFSQPWSRQLRQLLNRAYRIFNQGVSGQTAQWFSTNWSTEVAPLFGNSTVRNVVMISLGTNDIALGSNATTVYNYLTSLVSDARTAGAYSVGVATILPRSNTPLTGGGPAQEAIRAVLNPMILTNTAGADFVVDIGNDAVMGAYSATSNSSLYYGGLHPTALGQSYTCADYAAAINVWGCE